MACFLLSYCRMTLVATIARTHVVRNLSRRMDFVRQNCRTTNFHCTHAYDGLSYCRIRRRVVASRRKVVATVRVALDSAHPGGDLTQSQKD